MGTLMDKLNAVNTSKEQIRQAIERKKVSVPTSTPLKQYPEKIDAIYPDAIFLKDSKICRSDSFSVLENVIFENGVYISSGQNRNYYYVGNERDGWTKHNVKTHPDDKSSDIVYGNGVFVMAYSSYSDSQKVVAKVSTDGINWSQHMIFKLDYGNCNRIPTIVFNGNEFVVAFQDNSMYWYFFTSKDGKTWTQIGTKKELDDNSDCFVYCEKSKTYFMSSGTYVYKSTDLEKWSYINGFDGNTKSFKEKINVVNGIAFLSSTTTRGDTRRVHYYDESKTWTQLDSPSGYIFLGGTYKNGQYILIFRSDTSKLNSGSYSYFTVFVNNLSEVGTATKYWFGIGGALINQALTRVADCVSFANNTFFMCCGGGDVSLFSHDGVSWYDNIDKVIIDTNDNDVTYDTLIKMNSISAAVLQAAYNAGVNSI